MNAILKKINCTLLSVFCFVNLFSQTTPVYTGNDNFINAPILFDDDWRFYRGGFAGAEFLQTDDSKWRKLSLPHDWSIEDMPGTGSPFNIDAIAQASTGFTTGGNGWYRKKFSLTNKEKGKSIYIQFDGVYMNSNVWINGELLGNHPYGYTSFYYDISDKLFFDKPNVIAIQVQNEGANSRWYSGSGIYRHVWLKILNPVHVAQWGTTITTPTVTESTATVAIKIKALNKAKVSGEVTVNTIIINTAGKEVAKSEATKLITEDSSYQFNQKFEITEPQRWSLETPTLYTAITEMYYQGKLVDKTNEKFGIRSIAFSAEKGFQLNGKTIKLKGGCVHHDNGVLGAKAYDRAEQRKVELLKASGYNAIRTAHNPPSPAFLKACDELGMLVIEEAFDHWNEAKNPYDYHLYFDAWWQKDMYSMVQRDGNHPSIIMWSIGNEIPNMEKEEPVEIAKKLGNYVRSIDSSRPVSVAVHNIDNNKDAFFSAADIAGYNYGKAKYKTDHERLPNRVMFGSESYPLEAFEYWMGVLDNKWVVGDFVWTAFDYIGEASIGWRGYWQQKNFYPWSLAFCGDIDICGFKRPQSFYRDVLWKKDQLSIFVHPPKPSFPINTERQAWSIWHWQDVLADWNWNGYEGEKMQLDVYSSCEEVELLLNGKSLGKKKTDRSNKFIATWQVPYQSGKLKAVGYTNGLEVATNELNTATEPLQLKMIADKKVIKADGQDLSYITVELVDKNGNRHPKAENLITFDIQGAGTIVAVGNANPTSLESYQQQKRKAWHGRCLVVIKATKSAGKIILGAKSNGIAQSKLHIESVD